MDIVEMLVQLSTRHRFFAVLTQHQMTSTVHLMHGEIGGSNVFFAKRGTIEDTDALMFEQEAIHFFCSGHTMVAAEGQVKTLRSIIHI